MQKDTILMKILSLLLILILTVLFSTNAQSPAPDNKKILLLYETQQFAEASRYLSQFYTDSTTDIQLINSIAYSYRMAGDFQQASTYYNKLYVLDTLNTAALTSLAFINNQRGMYKSSMDLYKKLLAIDSTNISAYTALANLSTREKDIISAFNYLRKANILQPTNSNIAYEFVQLCLDLNEIDKADSVLTIALQGDPENANLLYSKARVSDEQKKYKEVIELCKKLIDLGENSQPIWSLMARAYFHLDDFKSALLTYTDAMLIYESWGEMDYYYMAMSCKALKRFDEGLKFMEKTLKEAISPNTGFYFAKKADLLADLNKPSAAAADYIRSFQYEESTINYFSLAVLYDFNLQNKANALKYYTLYLNKKPPTQERTYIEYAQERIKALK